MSDTYTGVVRTYYDMEEIYFIRHCNWQKITL